MRWFTTICIFAAFPVWSQTVPIEQILSACGGEALVLEVQQAEHEDEVPADVMDRTRDVLAKRLGISFATSLVETVAIEQVGPERFQILSTAIGEIDEQSLLWRGAGLDFFSVLQRQRNGVSRAGEVVVRVVDSIAVDETFLLLDATPVLEDVRLTSAALDVSGQPFFEYNVQVADLDIDRVRAAIRSTDDKGLAILWEGFPQHWGAIDMNVDGVMRFGNAAYLPDMALVSELMDLGYLERDVLLTSRVERLPDADLQTQCVGAEQ